MSINVSSIENSLSAVNSTRVGWVPDSSGRGTVSLLLSCLSTLILCVWSAIHLNLPLRDESSLNYTWRYFKWSIIGVFGPELVVWTAWRQYISARAIRTESRLPGHWRPKRKSSTSSALSDSHWTMTHGFYAGMGGFVIEMDCPEIADGPAFIDNCRRLYLTPRGVMLLAKCGLLPDITEEEILDKSKTDGLGKFLCCLQAGWMLLQVIARLVIHLPVTSLEINTIGHVVCAFLIFILWWNKPRWTKEPTRLEGDWLRPMCAFMYMSSQVSGNVKQRTGFLRDFGVKSEISTLAYIPPTASTLLQEHGSKERILESRITENALDSDVRTADEVEVVQSPNEIMPTPATSSHGLFIRRPNHVATSGPVVNLDLENSTPSLDPAILSMQQIRWKLAAEAMSLHPALQARFIPRQTTESRRYQDALRLYPEMPPHFQKRHRDKQSHINPNDWQECPTEQLITEDAGNWPSDDLLRGMAGLWMGAILWLASMGFGAVHIAGWHAAFPTAVEAWMWRCSSLYIVFAGMLWAGMNVLAALSESFWWLWYDVLDGQVHWSTYAVLGILCSMGGVAYVFSRAFLVVEAFVGLRSQPVAAYVLPQWTISIPHL